MSNNVDFDIRHAAKCLNGRIGPFQTSLSNGRYINFSPSNGDRRFEGTAKISSDDPKFVICGLGITGVDCSYEENRARPLSRPG